MTYVRDVLAGRPAHRTSDMIVARRVAPPGTSVTLEGTAGAPALSDEDAAAPEPPTPPGAARSTWERIALAPDIELHVRRPLSRSQNKLVDRLIQYARTLFADPT